MTKTVTSDGKGSKRFKMSIFAFVFFSIAGGGFMLKGAISTFTSWHANTMIIYLVATIIYAIPYAFMMFEFMSLKSVKKGESGYQIWLNAVIGKKYGFFGAFFYFFVNLFYFVDLLPNCVSYFMYMVAADDAKRILDYRWFKPIVGIVSILLFWLATFISARGPKWMSKIASTTGFAGLGLTLVFIVSSFVGLGIGTDSLGSASSKFTAGARFDISWGKVASISWALQSMGGLEALAAYKNNIKGGNKGFRKAVIINIIVFSSLMLLVSILAQSVIPSQVSGEDVGLLTSLYIAFEVLHFPSWWTNVIAAFMLITTFGGSLMIWTAAPVKMLLTDAPKGIFGKRLSKVTREGTPINGLIMQAIIVTFLLILNTLAQLNSGMNTLLTVVRNLDGGAATIPVIFLIVAFIKLRIQGNKSEHERSFYFLGRGKILPLIAIVPMLFIFSVATVASLIPNPYTFTDDLLSSILQIVMGPLGIIGAWLFCEYVWRKWKIKNPEDNSLFNEISDKVVKESSSATS